MKTTKITEVNKLKKLLAENKAKQFCLKDEAVALERNITHFDERIVSFEKAHLKRHRENCQTIGC